MDWSMPLTTKNLPAIMTTVSSLAGKKTTV